MKKSNKHFFSKNDFAGTGSVFRFTLIQMFKNKANWVSLIIMFLFSLASVPFMTLVSGDMEVEHEENKCPITMMYYANTTEYELDLGKFADKWEDIFSNGITIVDVSGDPFESIELMKKRHKEIASEIKSHEVLVDIYYNEETDNYCNTIIFSDVATEETRELYFYFADIISSLFEEARYLSMGATKEQVDIIMGSYYTNVYSPYEYFAMHESETENVTGFETQFAVQYVYSIIVLVLCMMSSTFIIRSIIEEKASKLVELLMVSIQPLAMIVGKILAVMIYVFAMLVLMFTGCVLSNTITGLFTEAVNIGSTLANMGISINLLNLSPATILIILISLVLGYFTFSIVAGIAGACCSSMDDVESANMSVVLLVMAGYLTATIVVAFESKMLAVLTCVIPIVSIFCAPVQYICGMVNFPILLLSWILQGIILFVLAIFASKIYRDLIMHKGSRIKVKELFGMAFHQHTKK